MTVPAVALAETAAGAGPCCRACALRGRSADFFAALARASARRWAAARARACFARAAAFALAAARCLAAAAVLEDVLVDELDEVDPEPEEVEPERGVVVLDVVELEAPVGCEDVELDDLAVGVVVAGRAGEVVTGGAGDVLTGAGSGFGPAAAKQLEARARAPAVTASTLSAAREAPPRGFPRSTPGPLSDSCSKL